MCMICSTFNPFLDGCPYTSDNGMAAGVPTGDGSQGTETTIVEGADAADDTSTAYAMEVGDFFHGSIDSASDTDWIKIQAVAGQELTLAVVGIGGMTDQLNDPVVTIYDDQGNVVMVGGFPASNDNILFTDDDSRFNDYLYAHLTGSIETTGTYYIEVKGATDAFGDPELPDYNTGDYGLSVTLGDTASYDIEMGAGALLRPESSWESTANTPTTVTWAFRETQGTNSSWVGPGSTNPASFEQFTAAQETAFLDIIARTEAMTGIDFFQINPGGNSDNADILIAAYDTSDGSGGYAWYPSSQGFWPEEGDIWINEAGGNSDTSLPYGSYSYYTLLHELGHALGLAHPATYDASAGPAIYGSSNYFIEDSMQYTVMSYFPASMTGASSLPYPDTFMLMDFLALHQLYGADMAYNAGNTVYGFNATHDGTVEDFTTNTDPFMTIWDGAGTDTLDLSGYSGTQFISLIDGSFSNVLGYTGTLSIAVGAIIENAIGGSGNDDILGNAVANDIDGGVGNDNVKGGSGADTIKGGMGNDKLEGGDQDDVMRGGIGFDELRGGAGADDLNGAGQADNLFGGRGDDTMQGGAGADRLFGGGNNDEMRGGAGTDVMFGETGSDTLFGGNQDDRMNGGSGFDTLYGGEGDDEVAGGSNADHVYGEAGEDTLLGGNGADRLWGGGNDDTLEGGNGTDRLSGDNGNDSLMGQDGNDTLLGGNGRDTLRGGSEADSMNGGTEADEMYGGSGDDMMEGSGGRDTMEGGTGLDTMFGGNGSDSMDGGAQNDLMYGGGAGDTIRGEDGDDLIFGDIGDDILHGSTGNDTIEGGNGDDDIYGGADDDVIQGGAGFDDIYGGTGNDLLHGGDGYNMLYGNAGFDTIHGGNTGDEIHGGDQADVLFGQRGNDHLFGGNGADILNGNANNDWLYGGNGDDVMSGGIGQDRFVFAAPGTGHDTITDFDGAVIGETIDMNALNLSGGSLIETIVTDGILLTWGDAGSSILLENVTNFDLATDVSFF